MFEHCVITSTMHVFTDLQHAGYSVLCNSVFAVQCLLECLEFQFDTVISDRSMILHKMFLLSIALKHHEILTWELFLNRFDTLCLEAQLDLDSSSDVSNLHGK